MNKSINLLIPEKHDTVLQKRIALLRVISLGCITLIVIASVSLFFLVLGSPLPELRRQENVTLQKLRELKNTSGKYYIINERLGTINTILNERASFDSFMTTIQEALPQGATIDTIKAEENAITLTVSSPSLVTINAFIDAMYQLKNERGLFSTLTLTRLRYDQQNPLYSVEVDGKVQL